MVTLYLSGEHIMALIGTVSGKRLTAQKLYVHSFTQPMIVDRKIIDVEAYTKALEEFFEQYHLPTQNINLILTSSMFISKMVELPVMKPRELMGYIPREFNDVENRKEPIYGCSVINTVFKKENEQDKGTKYQHIFAAMIEREALDDAYTIVHALKLKVQSVTVNQANNIRLMGHMPQVVNNTCIVQIMQGNSMTNILYINGNYTYSTTSRLFSEIDTPGYGVEIARSVSNIIQFMKAQQIDAQINNVYVAGISPDTFTYVDEGIYQINDQIQTDWISGEGVINWQIADADLTDNISMVSGLLTEKGPTSIKQQYKKHSPRGRAMWAAIRNWSAVAAVAAVMLLVVIVLLVQYFSASGRISAATAYLENPTVVAEKAEYEQLLSDNGLLSRQITYVQGVKEAINGYPLGDSDVLREFERCVGDLARVDVTSFDSASGTMTTSVTSDDVADINLLISNLTQDGMFTNVEYTGYTFEEGSWTVNVVFTLAASVGRE